LDSLIEIEVDVGASEQEERLWSFKHDGIKQCLKTDLRQIDTMNVEMMGSNRRAEWCWR
jgi:hypothetical protein